MNNKYFIVYLNSLRQEGNLAYEYNPFHNYQTEQTLYLVDNTFIVPEKCIVNTKNGEILNKYDKNKWIDKRGQIIEKVDDSLPDGYLEASSGTVYAQAGAIIDLDTENLNFDLEHPVDIEVQPSYDGSVNLILNDDKNIPRLINSRFSVKEKNTYEIVDRIGENDTNIYSSKYFNNDSSLYFQYTKAPIITFEELISGQFSVGQYCFYLTYCDSDGNESDIVSESNLIPLFIGGEGIPFSMEGGIKNERSNKGVLLKISNLDASYNYIKIRYVRYFADYQQNKVYEGKEIIQKYEISNQDYIYVSITGYEPTEDFDPNILNITKFNPKSILAQAQCKNMLFFGNITQNTDNYKELSDLSLRIVPTINKQSLEQPNNSYEGAEGYYNPFNMYYKVGYFNQEFYSFGIVYIYNNGTLSNVYPTLGYIIDDTEIDIDKIPIYNEIEGNKTFLSRNYIEVDNDGWIKDEELFEYSNLLLNSKGVCKINSNEVYNNNDIISIKFTIPEKVSKFLYENLGITGYFFVRQKRTPSIITQCYLMPFDEELKAPILEETKNNEKKYYSECFVSQKKVTSEPIPTTQLINTSKKIFIENHTSYSVPRKVTNSYNVRLREYDSDWKPSVNCYAGLCPDFFMNQPYYNQIFNSSEFRIQQVSTNSKLSRENRFWKEIANVEYQSGQHSSTVTICSVTDDVPSVAIKDKIYKLRKGQAEEAVRFEYAQTNSGEYNAGSGNESSATEATNIVRGMYSPFLAIYSNQKLETGQLYNIYTSTVLNNQQEVSNRLKLSEPYYAISDRIELINNKESETECYRGDCYINTFTHRLNRNFNDPSLPNNDVIVDENTWKDNYNATDNSKWNDIILSDLNAVQMGSWITFKCRSSINYALRSVDHSYVSEEALMGAPRSFYPKSSLLYRGENKLPESYLYNDAYRATVGYKCYYALQDVNYIKNNFSNRIQYSAIAIQDSFKNNYRDSLSTYHRDYSIEYGSIQKLVSFEGYLLVIMEHGIGLAVINERILAGQGDGNPVFINTQNVLPEELTIITDTIGTQWPESVIKTESGYVYGVDTVSKKIWRVKGQQLEIISDFKVNKFLIDNISLGERELYPTIGLKNIKTHYNNNKKDVMFTFYDDVYKDEEKVWNLCFNELLNEFVTFYSWVPSYSENIDTQFFTFNRNTSKWLSLLAKSNYNIPTNHGIVLDSPVCNLSNELEYDSLPAVYYSPQLDQAVTIKNQDGTTTSLQPQTVNKNIILPGVKFKIEKDHWQNYKHFTIQQLIGQNLAYLTEKYIYYPLKNGYDNGSLIYNWISYIPTKRIKEDGENDTEDITYLYLESDNIVEGNAFSFQMQIKVENLQEYNLTDYSTEKIQGAATYTVRPNDRIMLYKHGEGLYKTWVSSQYPIKGYYADIKKLLLDPSYIPQQITDLYRLATVGEVLYKTNWGTINDCLKIGANNNVMEYDINDHDTYRGNGYALCNYNWKLYKHIINNTDRWFTSPILYDVNDGSIISTYTDIKHITDFHPNFPESPDKYIYLINRQPCHTNICNFLGATMEKQTILKYDQLNKTYTPVTDITENGIYLVKCESLPIGNIKYGSLQRLELTMTVPRRLYNGNVKFTIDKLKIEGGDKCTPYTPYGANLPERIYTTLDIDELKNKFKQQKVIQLYVTPYYEYAIPGANTIQEIQLDKTQTVAFTLSDIVNNPMLTDEDWPALATDFYLHGQAGIFNVAENLYPTYWYGETHPFEFEFVVNDKIAQQKIFNNLVIVANKVEPESFHFEIEGDNYEFSYDKRTMYFRQEATKNLYQNLGSDILYNRKYTDIVADKYTQEQYYRGGDDYKYDISGMSYPVATGGLVQQKKSTIFPLYYNRIDTYNELYDIYREMIDKDSNAYDFKNLSGSEIKWYRDLNQFNIITHIKNSPIDLVGRLRGNSFYKEGTWNVQIPSIIFNQANEFNSNGQSTWVTVSDILKEDGPLNKDIWNSEDKKIPPIVVNSQQIPNDLKTGEITYKRLPNIYQKNIDQTNGYWTKSISTEPWTTRKEAKIRDKWMKVRIRYSGKNLAIIHSIMTLFNISYN